MDLYRDRRSIESTDDSSISSQEEDSEEQTDVSEEISTDTSSSDVNEVSLKKCSPKGRRRGKLSSPPLKGARGEGHDVHPENTSSTSSSHDVTMGSALGIEQAGTSQGTSNFRKARGKYQCVGTQNIKNKHKTVNKYGASTPSIPDNFNYGLPANVMEIIGREEEMEQLEECLNKDRRVAMGMGGLGKTTLAHNYAKKCITQSRISVIIYSETNETVIGCIRGLSACLKVSNAVEMPPVELMKDIVRILNNKNVLFVFDNVIEYAAVREYLPPKDNHNFKVLFTSQNSNFETFKDFKLKVLTEKKSLKLITSRLDSVLCDTDEKMKDVNELISIMQGLPLALLQAVAYIKYKYSCTSTYNVRQYIETYKEHILDPRIAHPYSANSVDSYKHTAYRAITINIQLMEKDEHFNDNVLKVLYYMAHLNPENISQEVLLKIVANEDILDESISLFTKYSLCEQIKEWNRTYLRAHRLILETVGKLLNDKTDDYRKDVFVNIAKPFIKCKLTYYPDIFAQHRDFFFKFLRTDWLHEAFKLEVTSEKLMNEIKDGPLERYAIIKLNVSSESLTFYHYAAYVGIPEVFVNIETSADVRHSDNIKSLGQIYEERKSSLMKEGNEQNECVMSENDGRVLVALADVRASEECVRTLVSGGAPATGAVGTLYEAAWRGDLIFIRELLDRGAPPDYYIGLGRTPLSVAAEAGNVDVMEELFSRGASVDKADDDGWTLLHVAVRYGRVKAVRWLLAHGANAAARDKRGGTSLQLLRDEYKKTYNPWSGDKDQIFEQIRNMLHKSLLKSL